MNVDRKKNAERVREHKIERAKGHINISLNHIFYNKSVIMVM